MSYLDNGVSCSLLDSIVSNDTSHGKTRKTQADVINSERKNYYKHQKVIINIRSIVNNGNKLCFLLTILTNRNLTHT